MLAKRVIPIQLLSGGRLVKTKQFANPRDVGNPVSSSRVYYANGADELVFLNIDRAKRTIAPLVEVMREVSEVLFVPLAAGGGVESVEDAAALIAAGADKVVVNSVCYRDLDVVRAIARRFGCQAVVVSIDVRAGDDTWRCYVDCGRQRSWDALEDHVRHCIDAGAGEILITSIDRDGMRCGYDLRLLEFVCEHAPTLPVVACGGAGNYQHLHEAFDTPIAAVAAGSLFNFGDNNPMRAKAYLRNHGIACR